MKIKQPTDKATSDTIKEITSGYIPDKESLEETIKWFYVNAQLEIGSSYPAKLCTAIAMHETGNFTSKLFQEQNNAFGMRCPEKRLNITAGCRNDYAIYNSVNDSIKDWILWFDYHSKNLSDFKSVNDIVTFMHLNGYFTASKEGYRKAVQAHYNKIKDY